MPVTTGGTIVNAAFRLGNVFMSGESVPNVDAQDALYLLNLMVSEWAQQALTIPSIFRSVTPLVSGKGGTANPYTIGVGGDINVVKPSNQASITAVGCLLGASVPPVEIPRGKFTDDGWQSTQIKDLTNTLFTDLYYSPTFPLGTIQLWPVPLDSTNSLVLYLQQALTAFVNLTSAYNVPDGVESALVYGLATRGMKPWGSTVDYTREAANALSLVKRSNLRLQDLPNDCVFENPQGWYNLNTGQ